MGKTNPIVRMGAACSAPRPRGGSFFFACLFLLGAPLGYASPAAELPRKILALYDSRVLEQGHRDIFYTDTHRFAEMPLNHLGLDVLYHDLAEPLPPAESLEGLRGVLTWFPGDYLVPDREKYCRWLSAAMDRGLKVVVLGNSGVDEESGIAPACDEAFAKLGFRFKYWVERPPGTVGVIAKDSEVVEFERKLTGRDFGGLFWTRALPGTTTYLSLGSSEDPEFLAEPVGSSSRGGVAAEPFVMHFVNMPAEARPKLRQKVMEAGPYTAETDFYQWRLNPFLFFEKALAVEGWPRPDSTTLNGRRLFYAHVDGDGFFNISERDQRSWSGEVFLDEFIAGYPDLPVTVSVITGRYASRRYGRRESVDLARRIFRMPNVEPASHGYTHPMHWGRGDAGVKVKAYSFDPEKEIVGSLRTINERFAAPGRPGRLMLWTGDCLPTPEQTAIAEDNGVLNMNGGDTRFDRRYNSVAFVSPLSRPLGRVRQIYSSNSNENTYTNLWMGPFYGYREVIETFENTERPRRLKPVNIYLHFYSAEKLAAIAATHDVFKWARSKPLLRIFASEYAELVGDFFRVRISRQAKDRWVLRGGPKLRTIRFDDESRYPDLDRSKGVLGFSRYRGSLYLALAESERREIVLTARAPRVPFLREANFQLWDWHIQDGGARFFKRGWGDAELVLGGLIPGADYTARMRGRSVHSTAGRDGSALFLLGPGEGMGEPSEVKVEPGK